MPIRLTGLASGLDTDSMVRELVSAYSQKLEGYKKDKTSLEWKQEKWAELNTKIYGFYTKSLSNMRMATSFASKKKVTVSDPSKAAVSAGSGAQNGTQTINIRQMAKAGYLTSAKLSASDGEKLTRNSALSKLGLGGEGTLTVNVGGEDKTITYSAGDTIDSFLTRMKEETGLNASFDEKNQRIVLNSESGIENDFSFKVNDVAGLQTLAKLGLATEKDISDVAQAQGTTVADIKEQLGLAEDAPLATKQDAQNAIIEVNGAEYESSSNTITVNGLTINAMGETNGPISVTTGTDTDGIYNMIKDFVKEYNSLINEITKLYNADSAKGYEPLSDDEKDEMSDTEIEKWETKIKDALLRRDDTLSSIMSTMTMAMSKGFNINGKNYTLASFGIETLNIMSATSNEHNAFHIHGDSDDSTYADKMDKLRAAIEDDPEAIQEFFTQLAKGLYNDLTKKMSSTSLSSAYTVYNDKAMKEDKRKLETTIKEWEERVSKYEETWYKKFAEMEKALTTLQSQTSSLTSLLGGA